MSKVTDEKLHPAVFAAGFAYMAGQHGLKIPQFETGFWSKFKKLFRSKEEIQREHDRIREHVEIYNDTMKKLRGAK